MKNQSSEETKDERYHRVFAALKVKHQGRPTLVSDFAKALKIDALPKATALKEVKKTWASRVVAIFKSGLNVSR